MFVFTYPSTVRSSKFPHTCIATPRGANAIDTISPQPPAFVTRLTELSDASESGYAPGLAWNAASADVARAVCGGPAARDGARWSCGRFGLSLRVIRGVGELLYVDRDLGQ